MSKVNKLNVLKISSTLVLFTWFLGGCVETESTVVSPDTTNNTNSTPVVEVQPPQNNGTESLPSNENQTQGGGSSENSGESFEDGFEITNLQIASRLKSNFISLHMLTLDRNEMKISFDPSCTSGQWVPWQENVDVAIPANLRNTRVRVSVQFKDFDLGIKECHVMSFTHDNQGPTIIFKKYPELSTTVGTDVVLQVEVTDASPIDHVTCTFLGNSQPCYAGLNDIKISSLAVGSYNFEVSAQDDLGNSSANAKSWTIVDTTKKVEQVIAVDNYKKVDILFVIDNSVSMEYEQKSMAQRTSNFLSVLRGLDYNIAITTTDPVSTSWGDGRLVGLTNDAKQRYVISSTMPEAEAQTLLSQTLQRKESGSGSEQGIRAAYRLIERWGANELQPRNFIRPGAQLAVVLISDEDESDNTAKNDPQNLVNLVYNAFNAQKRFNFHSIITRPGDTACKSTYGYSYGERYKKMSELTGGLIGDVCATDYASQVQSAAQGIRDLLKTLTLSCVPVAGRDITIKRDGVVVTASYRVEGLNLKFDTELDPGHYQVNYECLK